MLNYNKNDIEKSLKYQKIFNERWKKPTDSATYRKDNDIFNTREKKSENGKFYKKAANDIVEGRLDNKFRVKLNLNV